MFIGFFPPPLLEEHTKMQKARFFLKKIKFGIINLGQNDYFCEINSVRSNSYVKCLGYGRNPPYDRHSAAQKQKDVS